MSLTPDGRVTIPVDLAECKVELLGRFHHVVLERWVLAMIEEIEQLRATLVLSGEIVRELERKQFVGDK